MERLYFSAKIVSKKRILRTSLLITAVLVLSCPMPAAAAKKRIMPLGDSITRGWYGSVYRWGYRRPLYDNITSNGYDYDLVGIRADGSFPDPNHEGRDGWKADELLNGRPAYPAEGKLEDWLNSDHPDIVLLHIGTNDIRFNDQDPEEVNDILDMIDAYEQANNKHITVFLALIINRITYNSATTIYNNGLKNMALDRIAAGDDIIIVNMESALNYSTDMSDDLHPNDNGYTKMAAVWYDALAEYEESLLKSISGYVLDADANTPLQGVLIQTDDANDINAVTDANGFYELIVDENWSGIAAPQKEGYIFEPNVFIYNDVNQDYNNMNYSASLMTFKISGYVLEADYTPVNDINVSAENAASSLTDADGYYELWVDYNWSGNVIPRKYAYGFEPNSIHYNDVKQDYTSQDYTATEYDFIITGYIKNECSIPIEGILVDADNGGAQDTTDANGFYEVWVDSGWSGTVTPDKNNYSFDPNHMDYVDVLDDVNDQNYVANNVYDLDCDGSIGLGDFDVIAWNWLTAGDGDFDDDGVVDFFDFAELALAW